MQYIVFVEQNFKENETLIFYLQYTGNEEKLKKFYKHVKRADCSNLSGDYSQFHMQLSALISKQSVLEHLTINLGSYARMFSVCNGSFDFDVDSLDDLSDTEVAEILDENFFACRIADYFK